MIEKLLELLDYNDLRSVRKWCIEKNVIIITQGKIEFVFETEFILAYEKPFIEKLKRIYGTGWEKVYYLFKDGNIPALNILSDTTNKPINVYKPKTNNESKFLKKLEEYERKKKNVA